jgi:hypothetical protein
MSILKASYATRGRIQLKEDAGICDRRWYRFNNPTFSMRARKTLNTCGSCTSPRHSLKGHGLTRRGEVKPNLNKNSVLNYANSHNAV